MPLEFKRVNILGLKIGNDSPDGILTGNGCMLLLILLGFTAVNYFYNGLFRPLFTDKIDRGKSQQYEKQHTTVPS